MLKGKCIGGLRREGRQWTSPRHYREFEQTLDDLSSQTRTEKATQKDDICGVTFHRSLGI